VTGNRNTALILTGGGARAAYQIGVLKAIADQLPELTHPFPIICGTSAGALNAVGLAANGSNFRESVDSLVKLWLGLKSSDIYRTDFWGVAKRMSHFVKSFLSGDEHDMPASMLDATPLKSFLGKVMNAEGLAAAIEQGGIKAVSVTACGYKSGQSVSFFQGGNHLEGWHLGQRVGMATRLEVDHLLASSAIPTIFPPVKINREYFGDGVVRNMAPLSPAVHLGAERLLIIGVSANRISAPQRVKARKFPNLAQVMEHMLNGAFLDVIENDIDKALLINQLINMIPSDTLAKSPLNLKPLDILVISPSEPIDQIASRHTDDLPPAVRKFLGQSKSDPEGGASMASYLMFERSFISELIDLGYNDARAHERQIEQFLRAHPTPTA
tara:strand:- start:2842 stop:3993 length:1152 start_codon:yes stop_codon:yes gene_type:complete